MSGARTVLARLAGALPAAATFLSKSAGFWAIHVSMAGGGLWGWYAGWSEHWLLSFSLYLSVLSISLSMVILVGQRREGVALHIKVDELIRSSAARDELIGIEAASDEELEAVCSGAKLRN